MATPDLLSLRARDLEDMQVIAACLQDALIPVSDMAFLKGEKRFVLVANRFRWEHGGTSPDRAKPVPAPDGDARFEDQAAEPAFERVNCGVCFDRVRGVRVRGLDLQDKDHILNLLTIETAPKLIRLVFSGDILIQLDVDAVTCHLQDLSEPWPTHWRPSHDDTEDLGSADAGGEA